MDVGDLVYVVVLIVSAIVGTLGKRRKKKKAPSVVQEPVSQQDAIDWQNIFGEREEIMEQEEPAYESFQEMDKIKGEEPQKEEIRPKSKTDSQKPVSPVSNVIFDENDNEANPEIDLKQAIIYSEILKRPEY